MKSVSIIIPNWNGADLLRANLPSVVESCKNFKGNNEIILVDDASTDSSAAVIREAFPSVRLVAHRQNEGFGRACWSGALAAVNPVLIFLNSDVETSPGFIEPLAASFEDPYIFSASPLILDARQNVSNVTISIPYFRRGKIRYEPSPLQHLVDRAPALPHPWYTLFPPGAAFAVDRLRFIELQGFDDLFKPFYYEDTDLGFRAWRRGWQCIVVPASRVTHYHSGTIGRSFRKFNVSAVRRRNRLFYLWKNLTSANLLRQHILFQLLRICYRPFCLDGMDLIATFLAVPGFRRASGRRRTEQACTVNSEEKIFRIIRSAAQANRRAIDAAQ